MTDCSVYDLISALDTRDIDNDIIIEGTKINTLARKLRESNIKCLFNLCNFRFAQYEYPDIINASAMFITIKNNKERKRFNFHTKDDFVMEKLRENIEILF